MITTHDLCKKFGDFLAVDCASLEVGAGEVLALLGPNGAGKTTTVRMLTSILRPSSGWARVAGFDVVDQADQVRASVGVLTEHHGLYDRMPAQDYLDFFGKIYNLPPDLRRQRTGQLLEQFGLLTHTQKRIGEFSKGMRQKLALARALLHNPPVLLLDEPTSAMDPESARLVRDAIRTLRNEERSIVICTHNLAEAEELADQIAIIRRGKIIVSGSPSELKACLLGAPVYELRLAASSNGCLPQLPAGASLEARGENWLRYRTQDPERANPAILQDLIKMGALVISLQEAPRSLEQVYMQAINSPDDIEVAHVE
ncbi:MAG: ABC transporter ATP-binding protein [Anaerolineales bacterium]|nr:ABC transporter ATP-binding protein [Anaerolineales bacterium]